jgi:hypothetical protein
VTRPTRPERLLRSSFVSTAPTVHAPLAPRPHGGTLAPDDSALDADDTPPVDPRIGATIADRYRLDALLGAGGMGRVYRATHLSLGEAVAVKFLLAGPGTPDALRDELRARFRREAVVLARLRHPGIVSVIDFGEHEGELFLVMELLRGVGLDQHITAGDALLPLPRVVNILDQILQVLEAAHAAGVVHRDLKPENIVMLDTGDRGEKVKVLDFGIASLQGEAEPTGRLTQAGTVRGTPFYMAPEQCVGHAIGPPADIYAAGIILYEMLTGAPPFDGPSPAVLMSAQMFQQPPPLATRRGADMPVPAGLEVLLTRALSKRPEERPTARAFRDALALAQQGRDPVSLQALDAAARAQAAGLDRDARALSPAREAPAEAPANVAGPTPRVALWGFSADRADALRAALAPLGVVAFPITGTLPPAAPDRRPWQALCLPSDAHAARRTQSVRADALMTKVPMLVLDMADASEGPGLIRAGASDVALARLDDPSVCQKVLRAVRRGR